LDASSGSSACVGVAEPLTTRSTVMSAPRPWRISCHRTAWYAPG